MAAAELVAAKEAVEGGVVGQGAVEKAVAAKVPEEAASAWWAAPVSQ